MSSWSSWSSWSSLLPLKSKTPSVNSRIYTFFSNSNVVPRRSTNPVSYTQQRQQRAMEHQWQKQQQQCQCTQRPHTHAQSMSQSYFSIRSNARCANHQFIIRPGRADPGQNIRLPSVSPPERPLQRAETRQRHWKLARFVRRETGHNLSPDLLNSRGHSSRNQG